MASGQPQDLMAALIESVVAARPARCPRTVVWVDVDLEARCVLRAPHRGWHTDGVRWFDELGMQVPRDLGRQDDHESETAPAVETAGVAAARRRAGRSGSSTVVADRDRILRRQNGRVR